ncbi:integrase [Nocardioides ginsengisegetis]|uniref:Integrase n=1 Tax=Nocardioides ginsengisegetis TaxID=661491 RepID=A0A7W3P902_9ACTN|nr:integrase [Nocardioides ginsengisegetis]
MTARRNRGDGGIHWDEARQRWIVTVTVGYDSRGKRRTRRFSAITRTEANRKLKELLREVDLGLDVTQGGVTVGEVIESWLAHGLHGRAPGTVEQNQHLARAHIVPLIGKKRLRELRAHDVDRMLGARRHQLSTSTLQRVLSILRRAIRWAEARDLVGRNVALLCTAPTGKGGRPSKSMTLDQARALLTASAADPLGAYVTLGMLIGVRNEELRALTWDHVDLTGDPNSDPPVPPHVRVWRSVRAGGDTKTRLSRRTLALPAHAVEALERHRAVIQQLGRYDERGLVFCTSSGTALDSANVRRMFRNVCTKAGLEAGEWTPRELRHSFVSLMSDAGVPLEEIARLVGHGSTKVTETVYRKQLRPILTGGTQVMDTLFDLPDQAADEDDRES